MDVIRQIDLDFSNNDWTKIRQMYQGLVTRLDEGKLQREEVTSYGSERYRIGKDGTAGSLLVDDQHTEQKWVSWCGRLLEDMAPQFRDIGRMMQQDGLEFVTLTYNRIHGSIGKHSDGKAPGDAPRGQCNINYIIDCNDPHAETRALMPDGKVQWYPSQPGTAWCLDTSVPHWVSCRGHREFIQLCVHENLDRVVSWFDDYKTR